MRIGPTFGVVRSADNSTYPNRRDNLPTFATRAASISVAEDGALWRYRAAGTDRVVPVSAPTIDVDGASVTLHVVDAHEMLPPRALPNGATEFVFGGPARDLPGLTLRCTIRLSETSPVARFRYTIESDRVRRLTKPDGSGAMRYASVSYAGATLVTEVRLSDFNELTYAYELVEQRVTDRQFAARNRLIGPILVGEGDGWSALTAYEHGSPAPEPLIAFDLCADGGVDLVAARGNYLDGQEVGPERPFETVWFQLAVVPGGVDELARAYRSWVLDGMALSQAAREPHVYYNTWGWQERDKEWNDASYLAAMNEGRVLEEIDIAARMGVDVFVLDVGWFGSAGDWQPDPDRFPNGMARVRERLDAHGMQLGLWFAPKAAAVTSTLLAEHLDSAESDEAEPVWETEASVPMNLVDRRYADAFADRMIELVDELGATYFKWDGVNIDPTPEEQHERGEEWSAHYTFEIVRSLIRVAERITEARPQVIIDLDVTEPRRAMGLGFLSAGKFFHINHGRFANYFMPFTREEWTRNYVHLRAGLCRGPLRYDRWIPSTLFLTHYLPEGSPAAQLVNIASLILGQNGVWGDLPGAPEGCVELFGETIRTYKHVRDAITIAHPVTTGQIGSTTETYEKVAPDGRGAVVLFSSRPCRQRYTTQNPVDRRVTATDGLDVTFDADGRAILDAVFEDRGAHIAFFGVNT